MQTELFQTVREDKHKELLSLLNPLVDFMIANNYNYFLVAGKDGTATRHMAGRFDDLSSIITGMMQNNKEVKGLIHYCSQEVE